MDCYSIYEYLPKILRRIGIRPFCPQRRCSGKCAPSPDDVSRALEYLHSIHPDNGTSAIREHATVSSCEYDLQIIIPVYNTEKFVQACIDSVLNQKTLCQYIVTVINDGCTDRSSDIITHMGSDPHVEIINQPNKGFSGARNAGLSALKGRYIMFLDSDDMLADGCIQNLYEQFNDDVDIIGGGWLTIDLNDNIIEKVSPVGNLQSSYPWGKAFRAQLFKNIIFPEGYLFEDSIMGFLIFPIAKKMINIPEHVYKYRINPSGITLTSRGKPKILETLYVTLKLIKDRAKLGMDNDANFYDSLLYQAKMNQIRLGTFKDRHAQKAAFLVMRDIIMKCGLKTKSSRLRQIEEALLANDFPRFLWICNL